MRLHYIPEGARLAAPTPFLYENRLYVICAKRLNGFFAEGEEDGLFLLITEDGLHFTERPLGIRAQSAAIAAAQDGFHLFYTGEREICHAVSASPEGPWNHADFVISPDSAIYKDTVWQDPWLWQDDAGLWHMILGAEEKKDAGRCGCIAHCTSDNLNDWVVHPPLYAPGSLITAPASPCYFVMNSVEYLLYTASSDTCRVHYRYRLPGSDQWELPYEDTLDARGFSSGRFVDAGHECLIIGIVPTRTLNEWDFQPERFGGYDFNTWDTGGALQCHALTQGKDHSLHLSVPSAASSILNRPNTLYWNPLNGSWTESGGTFDIHAEHLYAKLLSENSVPDVCLLSLDLQCSTSLQRAALAVHVDRDFAEGYYFYIEPALQRVQLRTAFRMTDQGCWVFPHEVELESFFAGKDPCIHLDFLKDHDILTLYVNHENAMTVRLRDYTGRRFGLAAACGSARFSNIRLFTPAKTNHRREVL